MASAPKVLVALDFGDASLEALRQARELAHRTGGILAACHVLPAEYDLSLLFPGRVPDASADSAAEDDQARRALEAHAREKLGLELSEIFIERGSAYAQIVRRAEAWGATFVVAGSHNRTGISRVLLGSVAERVARHAHSSVLVARPSPTRGIVVAATDLSDPSLPAIAAGAEAARRADAQLVVVSALEWLNAMPEPSAGLIGGMPVMPPPEMQAEVRSALHITLEGALERAGATGSVQVLEGPVAPAIVDCANRLHASLIVVGSHGRTGLARLALGSVAEQVIRTASCSVLAVRTA